MNWVLYAIAAIGIVGVSDIFRKLASNLKDPFFTNLIFQISAFAIGISAYLIFSRKIEYNTKDIIYALIGGGLISLFSLISFKALALGPGASVVMPVLRIGGVALVALLGVIILREKMNLNTILGLIFSAIGIYLLFLNK